MLTISKYLNNNKEGLLLYHEKIANVYLTQTNVCLLLNPAVKYAILSIEKGKAIEAALPL